jgi:hypothetical protein
LITIATATDIDKKRENTKTPKSVEKTKGAKNIAKTIDTKTNNQARKARKLNIIKTPYLLH